MSTPAYANNANHIAMSVPIDRRPTHRLIGFNPCRSILLLCQHHHDIRAASVGVDGTAVTRQMMLSADETLNNAP